ncbi:uncharacterized protein LOC131949399 [Physella acuta]|uniref:uncharacterized protein LOC131949399 n=1 Tax=Physella acuta TaxID=109671 RepID=UPI0027DE7A47|nr:uncharacterized protein LOC131949399 [Physella acuta]
MLRRYDVTGVYVEVSDLSWLKQSAEPVLKKRSSLALTRQGLTWLYPTDLAEFICQVEAVDRNDKSLNMYAVIGVLCFIVAGLSTLTVLLSVKLRASRRGGELATNSGSHVLAQEMHDTNIYMNISGVRAVTDGHVTSADETKPSATAGYDTLQSELRMAEDGVYSLTVF